MCDPIALAGLKQIASCVRPGGILAVGGVNLEVRRWLTGSGRFEAVMENVAAIHDGDVLLRKGWPFEYWGLEPMDVGPRRVPEIYATIFQKARN
jgi:hypothetical protein